MADGSQAPEIQAAPHNIEAEQAILGALMVNNDVYDRVSSIIEPHHFFDPLHGRIFETAGRRIAKNALATPVTLKPFFEADPAMVEIGGPAYLARLAGSAVSIFNVRDYAQTVYDLALRRDLIRIGEEISAKATSVEVDSEPSDQIVDAEQQLYTLGEKGKYEGGFQSFLKAATEAVDVANAAYQREGGLAGISTGLMDMDKKLGGLHPSDLLILAGRPSMGKTSLATNIAFNIAKAYKKGEKHDGSEGAIDGGCVGFFCLFNQNVECGFVVNRELGKLLTVHVNVRSFEATNETAVIDAIYTAGSIDTNDPKLTKLGLLFAAVAISVDFSAIDCVLRIAKET